MGLLRPPLDDHRAAFQWERSPQRYPLPLPGFRYATPLGQCFRFKGKGTIKMISPKQWCLPGVVLHPQNMCGDV